MSDDKLLNYLKESWHLMEAAPKVDSKLLKRHAAELKEFPKEDVKNLGLEIIADLEKMKQDQSAGFRKEYFLKTDSPYLQDYKMEVATISSNNMTYLSDANTGYMSFKILKDPDDPRFESLKAEVIDLLMHEAGHIFIQTKEEKEGSKEYYDDIGKYFYDDEEIVLHSYAAWRRLKEKLQRSDMTINDIDAEKLDRLLRREVADIPRVTSAPSDAKFPKALQNKYVAYIMANIIKPKLNT